MGSKIKSILYLDKHKLYSISSQVFEGLTESVTQITSQNEEKGAEQKGKFFGGRLLASIVASANSITETRFLHDHSYVMLESELEQKGKVVDVGTASAKLPVKEIADASFVRLRGRVEILDTKKLRLVMDEFNKLGASLAAVTAGDKLDEARSAELNKAGDIKDRNQRAVQTARIGKKLNPEAIAKESELYKDPLFLKSLSHLMEFGFGDQLQVDMEVEGPNNEMIRISSILDRELLREREDRIIAKYSMFPQRDFVIFGVPVQGPSATRGIDDEAAPPPESMKQGVLAAVRKLSLLSDQFVGCGANEIMVDPIAIYLEL